MNQFKNVLRIVKRIIGIILFILFAACTVYSVTDQAGIDWSLFVFCLLVTLLGLYLILSSGKKRAENRQNASDKMTITVQCKSCGAESTLLPGEVKYCEYCGKLLTPEK